MIEKTKIQVQSNGMYEFGELIDEISKLSKEKRKQISMYVQGFLARDAMDKNKVS